jgi:hypothetical protein
MEKLRNLLRQSFHRPDGLKRLHHLRLPLLLIEGLVIVIARV